MFIHIGGETVVSTKEVISILDHHSVKNSKTTQKFIADQPLEKRYVDSNQDETKSYVITKDVIYYSPISSLTLKRRAQFMNGLDQFSHSQTELEELMK